MFLFGFLLFLAAEVAAFVAVGEHVGFGWAVLILLGASAIGPFVIVRVGLGVLARTQHRLVQGELPTRELLDGVVVLLAGAMICVPGFVTDALGLLLMVRAVRSLLIRVAGQRLARRVQTMQGVRWNVINVRAWPEPGDTPTQAELPKGVIESGERTDD
ncbi:MAG: FxsA family protein [Nitrososphaerales archaeon]